LGDCLLWALFVSYRSSPTNCTTFPHGYRYMINVTKRGLLGYILVDFFHQLIWSPCLSLTLAHSAFSQLRVDFSLTCFANH
jgi:hypothetical protein